MSGTWTYAQALDALGTRELFGMRFGLERMEALLEVLGRPHERFDSIQVLGTNGKSSTTRMTAAILQEAGRRTGAYTSPHLDGWNERIAIGGEQVSRERFADAVREAAGAAEQVDREADEEVTQFELLTAAAYLLLAQEEVEIAVIEAGLGGRFDATSVVDARVQALTNVGLEHTRWLGPTVEDIAREKLAVCRPGSTLLLGEVPASVLAIAQEIADERGARLIRDVPVWDGPLAAAGGFQRRNFALAVAIAEAQLGTLDRAIAERAARWVTVPARFERIGDRPLTIRDGAHNPAGIEALLDALGEEDAVGAGDPLVFVVSILDDKDAARMLELLVPRATALVCTSNTSPRALPPATLTSLARQVAGEASITVVIEPDPPQAVTRARVLAGDAGTVVVTGSIHLMGDLAAARAADR
jgi:dihydrofolate synthase/folylpolyglutamate synthase